MSSTKRFVEIDLLRGLAMLGMILNHVAAYFLSYPGVLTIWEVTQFSAPVFVFCSAFLFFHKDSTTYEGVGYVLKRLERLLLPYYLFLIVILPIMFYFEPTHVTSNFIVQNIFLTGGIDINWLVALVLEFAILLPILALLLKKYKRLMIGFGILSALSLLLLLFYHWPYSYLLIMWLPWSFFAFLGWLFRVYKQSFQFLLITSLTSVAIYAISIVYLLQTHQSLSFFQHKYPPDIYMVSFGVWTTIILFIFFQKVALPKLLSMPIHFFSFNSYTLYFIHYVLIYVLSRVFFDWFHTNIWITYISILSFAVGIQYILNAALSLVDKARRS